MTGKNGSMHAYLYMLHPVRPTFTQDITPDEATDERTQDLQIRSASVVLR